VAYVVEGPEITIAQDEVHSVLGEALENGVGRVTAARPSFLCVSRKVGKAVAELSGRDEARRAGEDCMGSGESDDRLGGTIIEEGRGCLGYAMRRGIIGQNNTPGDLAVGIFVTASLAAEDIEEAAGCIGLRKKGGPDRVTARHAHVPLRCELRSFIHGEGEGPSRGTRSGVVIQARARWCR
jgi:hypothetical protein